MNTSKKTIVGLYDDHHTAEKVERSLTAEGVDRDAVKTYHHHAAGTDTGLFSGDRVSNLTRHGVPKDEAQFFIEGVRRGGSLVVARVDDDRAMKAAEIMNRHEPVRREERLADWRERDYTGFDADAPLYSADEAERERSRYVDMDLTSKAETKPTAAARSKERTTGTARTTEGGETERIQVAEEELHVGKREVSRGGVSVHTWVEEKPVQEKVHLHEERVDVERKAVDRPVRDADAVFEERSVEMKETAEEVVVDKEARVVEEVVVKKEGRDRTETVEDTVRRTHVDVDENARTNGYDGYEDGFRTHYTSTYGDGDRDYDFFAPAYRHGYTYGTDDRYADRDYDALEPDMRNSYEERHGKGTWEKIKDAVRHAFHSSRSDRTRTDRTARTTSGTSV